jgi:trehalose 6-phosphate phosphatase
MPTRKAGSGSSWVAPQRLDAFIFDLDGVITDTRRAHEQAWSRLFAEYREEHAAEGHDLYAPFSGADYREHLDGRPRFDGIAAFLASRGIDLPWGNPDDDPQAPTICGLGNRKNRYFADWLDANNVETYPDAVALLHHLRAGGIKTAIISASKNCAAVLKNAGIAGLFDARVDGVDMAALGLPGKPEPAIFRRAAELLSVAPDRAAVIEDALAGVEAGRCGGFALVVGVVRDAGAGQAAALRGRGADLVTDDLRDLIHAPAEHDNPGAGPGKATAP